MLNSSLMNKVHNEVMDALPHTLSITYGATKTPSSSTNGLGANGDVRAPISDDVRRENFAKHVSRAAQTSAPNSVLGDKKFEINGAGQGISSPEIKDPKAWQAAQDFETAFISQMLNYSGLAEALTSSGGEDVASFSQFYLESLAADMSKKGGFGLADKIYNNIKSKEAGNGELGKL